MTQPAPISQLERAVIAHRRALQNKEAPALRALARRYAAVERQLVAQARRLMVRHAGMSLTAAQALRLSRINLLVDQTRVELERLGRGLATTITTQQRAALISGGHNAAALMGMEVRGRLQSVAAQELLAAFQPRTPLRLILSNLPAAGQAAVSAALFAGTATGQNPIVSAGLIRGALGGNLTRALTIARTETLRAYRSATLQSYQANSDFLEGWVWIAASGACAFCQARHGSTHELDETMATHPNCRCSMAPVARSALPAAQRTRVQSGSARFAAFSPEKQKHILGPGKYNAYRSGLIKLDDVAGERFDPAWGRVGFERPLSDLLGRQRAAALIQKPTPKLPARRAPVPPAVPLPVQPAPAAPALPALSAAEVEKIVRAGEQAIRMNKDFETLIVYDKTTGAVLLNKPGGDTFVYILAHEDALMKGNILTHNHPLGLGFPDSDPRSWGNSFSKADMKTAAENELAEMRAVTPKQRFSIKPGPGGWNAQLWRAKIEPSYTKHRQDLMDEGRKAIVLGTKTNAEYDASFNHDLWTRVARELGLDYHQEDG